MPRGGRIAAANNSRGSRVLPNRGNRLPPQPPSTPPALVQLPVVQVERLQVPPRGGGGGRLRSGLRPTRGARGHLHQGERQDRGDSSEEDPNVQRIVALTSLCESLQDKLQSAEERINSAEERFNDKIEEARQEARDKVEEENSILQYKLNQNINTHLAQIEGGKQEKFNYRTSGPSIKRIVEVRNKVREAVTEGERDFEDFSSTKTGKILQETLDLLDQQEGLIRLAETSKFGYKILDKVEGKKETPALIKDPVLLKKISDAEKTLENEAAKKSAARRRSRTRSRTRSRSPSKKKGAASSSGNRGFACHFCSRQGHSFKSCSEFRAAAARDGVEYDFQSRRFYKKNGEEVKTRGASRSPSRSRASRARSPTKYPASRDTYTRSSRWGR